MGSTRVDLHTDELNELAAIARLLAHPARLAILQHLIDCQTCVCAELVDEIGLAQPTISQHLKELRTGGLLQGTVEGVRTCYCIDLVAWNRLRERLLTFLSQNPAATDACC